MILMISLTCTFCSRLRLLFPSSCECERSISTMRRLNSYMRCTMGESRLSSLAIMHIRGGSRIFLGVGALVSCSTSTPVNHIVFFCRIPVVLENRRSSRGGGGGAHPLHPPPRSAPAYQVLHSGQTSEICKS